MKKMNGITLIALVITIIVLLILAGVSIAMVTGDNGIIAQAQNAAEKTEIAQEKEQISLAYTSAAIKKPGGEVTYEDLNDEFESNGTNATANNTDPITVTFPDTDRTYTIEDDGTITGPESGEIPPTEEDEIVATMKIEGTKVETPPMPTGFSYVDGTVDDGYIIQDESENQFVWVPVEKDQKLQINVTSGEDIESITLTDPYGDTILTESNVGTSYSKEQTPTINGPYVLNVKTASEEKNFSLGVHSLYAIDTMVDWMLTDEYIESKMPGQTLESTLEQMNCKTVEEAYLLMGAQAKEQYGEYKDTEEYSTSVNENGGFYIGRYEASEENGNVAVKGDVTPWNDISQIKALDKAEQMYNSLSGKNFESSLLTGAAWDRTLGWLEETGAVTPVQIVGNSKTWGNYIDDDFSGTIDLAKTGEFSQTEKNHIYDLAGNLAEWTTEAYSTGSRVGRGGHYGNDGSNNPASIRYDDSPDGGPGTGFRLALYL